MVWRIFFHRLLQTLHLVSRPDIEIQWSNVQPKPKTIDMGALCVVTSAEHHPKWACFHCPGCGELFYRLPLTNAAKSNWSMTTDWLGRPSLSPSVRQKKQL